MQFFRAVFLAALCVGIHLAYAGSLGVIGPVHKIKEQDMQQWIESKIKEKMDSGEIARLQNEQVARAREKLTNPEPIAGIQRAQKGRTFYYDPTFTVHENVLGERGEILVPAGTTINPLDRIGMSRTLIFFDARDKSQVTFAKKYIESQTGLVKPILVGGSYLNLMKSWQLTVYFDQQGTLVKKFSINNVPAIVKQEGNRLRIAAIAL